MGTTFPEQVGFNGGRLDSLMNSRTDLSRVKVGCSDLANFIPTVQGPAVKRSGFRFLKGLIDETKQGRLLPFEFSRDQAYVVELGVNKMRFMRDSGAVLETPVAISAGTPPTIANPCVITTNAAHGYSTGNEIFITGSRLEFLNDQFFTVTVTGATTFTLSQNGGSAISSVGESLVAAGTNTVARTYQIADGVGGNAIPWAEADLPGIQVAQDADVMYLAHPSYPVHKLVRTSDTSWTCAAVTWAWPPFLDENITTTTVYASAATGSGITITASSAIFTANMVGGYIRIAEVIESIRPPWKANDNMSAYFSGGGVGVGDWVYNAGKVYELKTKNGGSATGELPPVHDYGDAYDTFRTSFNFQWTFVNRGAGYAKITAIGGGGTTATADVIVTLPKSVLTAGTATRKWSMGAFSAEYGYPRGISFAEQSLWLGGTDHDPDAFWGSRTNRYEDFERIPNDASGGKQFRLASSKRNQIRSIVGAEALVMCTAGGETTVGGSTPDEAITGDNVKARPRSAYGCADNVTPIFVDSALIMAHRNAKRIMEIIFDVNTERYAGVDLTGFASRLITDASGITYQASPYRQIIVNTTGGDLYAQTYAKEEDVAAWTEYETKSTSGLFGTFESAVVIPHPDGDQDQLWVTVKRTTAGGTRRFIEILEKPFETTDSPTDAFFVDAGLTYSGAARTTIVGLLHLAGESVDYLSNGVNGTGTVTSKGKLVVSSTTTIHVGYAVKARLETMDFNSGQAPYATTLGDKGRIASAVIRVDTMGSGLYVGQSLSGTMDLVNKPVATPLYTGDVPVMPLPGGVTRQRRVALEHRLPLPFTVLSIAPKSTEEKS